MNRALRLAAPVALAAASALVLAGCAGGGDTGSTTDPTATTAAGECMDLSSGSASDSITADGAFGETPNATFETPVEADELQRSILIEGDGDATKPGDVVDAVVTLYSATSGEQLASSPASFEIGDASLYRSFTAAVDCVPIGTRTVTVAPAADAYGEEGNPSIGVNPGEAVIIVADVTGMTEQVTTSEWTENVPEVTFNGDEPPTVVIPDTEPSTELLLKVLEEGDGETVEAGDQVSVKYQGLNWATKEIFDQSYPGDPATFGTDQVIAGFGAALVGQKVGTKLIVTIPPEFGYGTDAGAHELGGQTLVFVVEITDTTRA
jgi:peptidylprolyl isomerase